MRRLSFVCAALLGVVLLSQSGCGAVTAASPAELSGTYDLALVNDLLFVTSAYKNELRVLDISKSPRDFIRAPNPLEPLSIPTVDNPVELATDVSYDTDGNQHDGQFVYARGLGSPYISVIGAARDQLKELTQVKAGATVTALAATGPATGGPSTLFYGTWDGERGTLWRVSIPEATSLAQDTPLSSTVITSNEGEAIRALAVMPDGVTLAVGTHDAVGDGGRTVLLNVDTLATQPLAFPAPVRRLLTHPAYVNQVAAPTATDPNATQDTPVPAGARVFGVLDETSCGGKKACTGLLAVDVDTGEIARDTNGYEMTPLVFGHGLINGVTLHPNADVYTGLDQAHPVEAFSLVGVVTTAGETNVEGGEIFFFDAGKLSQKDANGASPSVSFKSFQDAAGNDKTQTAGPQVPDASRLGNGALESQNIFITYQGILAGLKEVPTTDADGQRFVAEGVDVRDRAAVGDLIQVIAPDPGCTLELTVGEVQDDAVVAAEAIPAACHDRTAFTVRAAGSEPYTVEGSATGYLGRVGANETFTYPAPTSVAATLPECAGDATYCAVACPPGEQASCKPGGNNDYSAAYFYHPPNFDPFQPAISFDFAAPDSGIARGDQYVWSVSSGYLPLFITLDTSLFPGWYLPAAVVWYQKTEPQGEGLPDVVTELVYVSYPSAQGVAQINPATLTPLAGNTTNVIGFR